MAENAKQGHTGSLGRMRSGCRKEGTMLHRKKRGGLVTELALRVGATLAVLGSAIAMKASQEVTAHAINTNVVQIVPGDLYLPFDNAHTALYVGLAMATAGVLARLFGYIKLHGGKTS